MYSPGATLIELCKAAQSKVVLVAPFIKASVMNAVLKEIPEEVVSIECVTRWRPEEVLVGVSDLEILDIITQRKEAKLLIQPLLHAKYFRVDSNCLVGSANLTRRALGWSTQNNMELVVNLPFDMPPLEEFERTLLSTATPATQALKEEIEIATATMKKDGLKYITDELYAEEELIPNVPHYWLPMCKRPEVLHQIYSGRNTDQIVDWTLETGRKDIYALRIPTGLSETTFNQYVAALMHQSPVLRELNAEARKLITPAEGKKFITTYISEDHSSYSATDQWDILCAWLLFFLKKEYRQPFGTSDIQKGSEIGSVRF